MVELRVVAEDALFIERNSPFTAKIGGHPGQRSDTIVQLADPPTASGKQWTAAWRARRRGGDQSQVISQHSVPD